jgi:hypothetical protein
LAEILIAKIIIMKDLFFRGGPTFMGIVTILFIITTAWIIYQFVIAYNSEQVNHEKALRKLGYGKTMGLFAMVTGCMGQLIGLRSMFDAIETLLRQGEVVKQELVFEAIGVTMIVTIYGILIYLFALLLWFVASIIIEKKFNK